MDNRTIILARKKEIEEFLGANREKSIYFFGTGNLASELVKQIDISGLKEKGFLDTSSLIEDTNKTGQQIGDFNICAFDDIEKLDPDIVVLTLEHSDYAFRKLYQLKKEKNFRFSIVQDLFKPKRDTIPQEVLALMPNDIEEQDFYEIYYKSRDYTMTGLAAMYSLYQGIKYIVKHEIPGDIAECGVFKGGSCLVAAYTLMSMGITDRRIYLYDTFGGMSTPTNKDTDFTDISAKERMKVRGHRTVEEYPEGMNNSIYSLDIVKKNMYQSGYPQENIIFVRGKVEDTIPDTIPEEIAVLRLDTDWYESTYHELTHLYPRLSPQGILILDDYGHWRGARLATDEYFEQHNEKVFLNRITDEVRFVVKPASGVFSRVASSPVQYLLSHTLAFCDDCLNREDYTAAWQALCRAASMAPNRPDILCHRGRLALFLKDGETAQCDFAAALAIDPRCTAAWSGLARYHLQQGEPAEAEAAADRALVINPADEEAAQLKAELQEERG